MWTNQVMDINHFTPGPVQTFSFPGLTTSFKILRLDLLRSWASGNKYYKLKYVLRYLREQNIVDVVSKGGMFSNHLMALAEACASFKLSLTCIIRAYEPDPESPTISRIRKLGCSIHFMQPPEFDLFDEVESLKKFPGAFFIPEGGLSKYGLHGAGEIAVEIIPLDIEHIVIAGGSMCTACGLLANLPKNIRLHIVPAWKGCTNNYMEDILAKYQLHPVAAWDLWPDYHFGGFGKYSNELIDFMTAFTEATGIPLDPVYNAKTMFALRDKIESGYFKEKDKILVLHTGGLQGLDGYHYRFPEQWGNYCALVSTWK